MEETISLEHERRRKEKACFKSPMEGVAGDCSSQEAGPGACLKPVYCACLDMLLALSGLQ